MISENGGTGQHAAGQAADHPCLGTQSGTRCRTARQGKECKDRPPCSSPSANPHPGHPRYDVTKYDARIDEAVPSKFFVARCLTYSGVWLAGVGRGRACGGADGSLR